MNSKVFKIKNYEGYFSDEQIVSLIKSGQINGEDALYTRDLKSYIKIKDSIYQYYLERKLEDDETI